jgi:hypothetical protein
MRSLSHLAIGLCIFSFLSSVSHAEPKNAPARSGTGDTVRYFQFVDELLGDLPSDAFLREVKQGGKVTSAMLDVCYSVSQSSIRKDRFQIPLNFDGGRLTGTGQSQEDNMPITVNLVRKQTGKTVAFEGSIMRGSTKTNISSTENMDMSEKEFQDGQSTGVSVVAKPPNFLELSPDSIGVRVKRAAVKDLVKILRNEDVEIVADSLVSDCASLRSGQQVVHLFVDPERAPALVDKLKTSTGILAVGWTEGAYSIENAVRFAAQSWRFGDDKLDRERLAKAIADSAARAFGATLESSVWDGTTGELKLKVKAPSQSVPGMGLADIIVITALVGPEKLGKSENLIIWLDEITIDVVDEGPEPRLRLLQGDNADDMAALYSKALIADLANALSGRTWDSTKSSWK